MAFKGSFAIHLMEDESKVLMPNGREDGAKIVIADFDKNNLMQYWQISLRGAGRDIPQSLASERYAIYNLATGLCLANTEYNSLDGEIVQETYLVKAVQEWDILINSDNTISFYSVGTNSLVLEAELPNTIKLNFTFATPTRSSFVLTPIGRS